MINEKNEAPISALAEIGAAELLTLFSNCLPKFANKNLFTSCFDQIFEQENLICELFLSMTRTIVFF